MPPIRSSDHAERSLHCPVFGTTEHRSAWTIRGSGPACCRRLASVHAERSASHIISLRERVSIRETLSPLDEPSSFREKARWRRRSGGSARRGAADPPLVASWGRGYRLLGWSGFPDQTGLCETGASRTRGSSDLGMSDRGVADLRGACPRGYTLGHEQDTLARARPAAAAAAGHRLLRLDLHSVPPTDRPARDSAARPTEYRPRPARQPRRQRQPREPQTHTPRLQLRQARRTPAPPPSDGNRTRIFLSWPAGQPAPA